MSDIDCEISQPIDQSTPKQKSSNLEMQVLDMMERKSLQTLQPSAADSNTLVGLGLTQSYRSTKNGGREKSLSNASSTQFHKHAADVNMHCSIATQTDDFLLEDLLEERLKQRMKRDCAFVESDEDEAFLLMVKEPTPESYWEETAEQRRIALSDTLGENKSLSEQVESLKEDNERLSLLASQAEELSALLQSVVSDDHENTDDTQSCQISGDVRNHHNCLTSSPETNTSTRQQFHSDLPSNLSDISKSDENNAEKSSEDKSILMCDQDDKNAGEEDTNNVCKK